MFLRVVLGSLTRRWRRKLAATTSVALATGAATGLLAVLLSVGDAVRGEFHSNRHNILVEPSVEGSFLRESDLARIRHLKWRNQLVAWAPLLPVELREERGTVTLVGTRWNGALRDVAPAWELEGSADGAIVGRVLADRWDVRLGQRLRFPGRVLTVSGILSTGEEWDEQILVDLAVAQEIAGRPGQVRTVLVRAVTTPDSEIVRKFQLDPKSLSPRELEKFHCTPFAATIAKELTETIPDAEARPIRRATEMESKFLGKIEAVLLALALAALFAGGIGVMSAMAATVVDRRREIGLWKALGATDAAVASLFLAEATMLALVGGAIGSALGWAASGALGRLLLGRALAAPPAVLLLAVGVALVVALGGMAVPLRAALRVDPKQVLHEV